MNHVSDNPAVQSRYDELVASGESHRMAELLACRQFPATRTDVSLWQGRHGQDKEMESPRSRKHAERRRAKARSAGVNPDANMYISGLARFPGDPMAYVATRGEAKERAKAMGRQLLGVVNYTPPGFHDQHTEEKPYRVADDIVADAVTMKRQKIKDAGESLSQREAADLIDTTRRELQPAGA